MLTGYLVRRVLVSIPVLIGVTLFTFLLLHATAGSFVPGLDDTPGLRPEDVERIRHNLGLDQPVHVQYLNWIGVSYLLDSIGFGQVLGLEEVRPGLLQLDFGRSLIDGSPVVTHIAERLPLTLELTATSMALAIILAIPLGVVGAVRRGERIDHTFMVLSVLGVSVPTFWLGLLMILVFSVRFHDWGLPWLPSTGAYSPLRQGDVIDHLTHLVMPAVVLSFGYLAVWSRYARSSMIEALSQDYVRTARSKGLSERRVRYDHALRNAMTPLVTLIGLEFPALVSGGAIVEVVFGWPGIGRLALERALKYDFTMVMGLTTFAAILVIVGSLIADVLYGLLDPRIQRG
jgi:peptide/nickel transport system permease protein